MLSYDVVFLVDDTGSMKDYITKVKQNITSLVTSLNDKEVDFRFGIVQFGDVADSVIKQYEFTTDIDEFISNLSAINSVRESGGDGPESGLEAIMSALSMNFRNDANKYFILVTDNSFHNQGETGDGNPNEYLNKSDVINTLKNANVQMDVIGKVGGNIQKSWESIITHTNGQFYDMTGDFSIIFKDITGDVHIPDDAFVYNGHSYYLYSDVANTWEEAKKYCEDLGGHLAIIDNNAENTALFKALQSVGVSNAYFGLSDANSEGSWKWVDGSSLTYRIWGDGEPNSENDNENYAEFYYKYPNGEWNDGNFSHGTINDSKNFICEWDVARAIPDNDTSTSDTSYIPSYDDLTPEQLQKVQESSILSLTDLMVSAEKSNPEITPEDCGNDPNIFKEASEWTKVTKFLAKMQVHTDVDYNVKNTYDSAILKNAGIFSILADFNDIIVEVQENFLQEGKNSQEKESSALKISSKLMSVLSAAPSVSGTFKELFGTVTPFMFLYSALGYVSNVIAPMDNLKEKRQEIEKGYIAMLGEGLKYSILEIGEKIGGEAALENVIRNIVYGSGVPADVVKATNINALAKGIAAPLGPIDAGVALLTGVVCGVNQYNDSKAQYDEDSIPTATRDALLDASIIGFLEGAHKYLYGADEAIVQVGALFGAWLTGSDLVDVSEIEGGYMEEVARSIKYLFLNEISGTDSGDVVFSKKDNEFIYGGYGNDWIENFHSNMTIYGGADCDTVISNASNYRSDYGGTAPIGGTHNSYIDLGRGNDSLAMHDYNSTVYGGSGNDTLIVVGDDPENPTYGNKIYGDAGYGDAGNDNIQVTNVDNSRIDGGSGNDYILLRKVTHSTVHGGTGSDYIELDILSNNNVIEYRRRDFGNDVIVGYNSSDTIKFNRLINGESYSTVTSGNDLIICVGNDSITVKDANGKQLNIETNYVPSQEDLTMKNLIAQKQKIMSDLSVVRSVRGDLRLRASEGEVSVEDVRDNLISVADNNGNITAQVYVARAEGGEVAGNALGDSPDIFKVIVGASENQNQLIAGDGGSSLFGGLTDDILQGGISTDAFNYHSGNDTINAYDSWENVTFGGTYEDWAVTGDDFVINAAEGSLRVQSARDKLLEFKNSDGSILAHVCMPSDDSTFDGSTYNEFVVAVGANNHSNILIAGNAGSSLWGGDGDSSDSLFGGAGADAFIYRYGNGEDNIFYAAGEDSVILPDITLNEIYSVFENQDNVNIGLTDGGALNIDGKVGTYILRGTEYPAKPTPFSLTQLKRGVMER